LRLLFTIPDFWPQVRRGSERLVRDLSLAMAARDHEVTVLTRPGRDRPGTSWMDGFQVSYAPRPRIARRVLGLDALEGFAITAASHGLRRPADVHHSFYISDAFGLTLAGRLRRRPLIFSWHGVPERAWWEAHRPRTHRWYLSMSQRADVVTVMSEASAEQFRRDYDRPAVILTPGVFAEEFNRPRAKVEQRVIVCAAAIDDGRKRIDLLLGAFEIVARKLDDIKLLLVGHGDPSAVQGQVARMDGSISSRIDWRPEPDLPAIYAGCAVGALTSYKEAFGLVAIEYLAAGMPALVSDDGGAAEIITPGTGVTFASGDLDACAAGMQRALELADDPSTTSLCVARARDYDWSTRATAYEDLYRKLA
jgi:glycosyltransferase involved in cell wall biosynthesis